MKKDENKKNLYKIEVSRNFKDSNEISPLNSNTFRKSNFVFNTKSNNTLYSDSTTKYLKTEETKISSFGSNHKFSFTSFNLQKENKILISPLLIKKKKISTLATLLDTKNMMQQKTDRTINELQQINSSRNDYIKSKSNELRKIYSNFLYIQKNYSKKKVNIVEKNTPKIKVGPQNFKEFSYREFHKNVITSTNYWFPVKDYTPACYGSKNEGVQLWYGVNSHKGRVQESNNDRIKIILNVPKPVKYTKGIWPICSYFAIFSGFNGKKCTEYLKDNLHHSIFSSQYFPMDISKAIFESFKECEKNLVRILKPTNCLFSNDYDKSAACAVIVIIVNQKCYAVNLGNSKIILSEDGSQNIYKLFKEHDTSNSDEISRIQANRIQIPNESNIFKGYIGKYQLPGNRTITRAFGDLEAKNVELFGDPNVIISVPDIAVYEITRKTDFILLGNNGVFQRLSSREALNCIYESTNEEVFSSNIQEQCGKIVDLVMKTGISRKTNDNLTCIFICFQNFKFNLYERCERNSITRKEYFQSCKKLVGTVQIKENLKEEYLVNENDQNTTRTLKEINSKKECYLLSFVEKMKNKSKSSNLNEKNKF